MTQVLIGAGIMLAIVLAIAGIYFYASRQGRKVAEGQQAQAGIKVATDIAKVPQPLPGETDQKLKDGAF